MTSLIRFYHGSLAEFNRLFDDASDVRFWPSASPAEDAQIAGGQHFNAFRPKLDLHGSRNSMTATFELPCLKSRHVIIDLYRNRLTVSGESSTSNSHEDDNAVREGHYGKFSRTLQLPFGTRPEDVKAKMENGQLTLTFSKATPEQQPHYSVRASEFPQADMCMIFLRSAVMPVLNLPKIESKIVSKFPGQTRSYKGGIIYCDRGGGIYGSEARLTHPCLRG